MVNVDKKNASADLIFAEIHKPGQTETCESLLKWGIYIFLVQTSQLL